jgi:hypothetical protein
VETPFPRDAIYLGRRESRAKLRALLPQIFLVDDERKVLSGSLANPSTNVLVTVGDGMTRWRGWTKFYEESGVTESDLRLTESPSRSIEQRIVDPWATCVVVRRTNPVG